MNVLLRWFFKIFVRLKAAGQDVPERKEGAQVKNLCRQDEKTPRA